MESMTYVDELTEEVCRQLLEHAKVGRVAFVDEEGYPVVLPVNFRMHDGHVVFRTTAGSMLEQIPKHKVSFQVDHLAPDAHSGWSVLARGRASGIDPTDDDDGAVRIETWEPGSHEHWLVIRIESITGRQIVKEPPAL